MVRYFPESSALAKYYHPEAGSDQVLEIFDSSDRLIYVSRLALVELISVAGIKQRTGVLSSDGARTFLSQFQSSVATGDFLVLEMDNADYALASNLLGKHAPYQGLRTLDALHLSVALRSKAKAGVDAFVTADRNLAAVAVLEGLAVVNPEAHQ